MNLVLTLPHGSLIATNLGLEGLAWHLSPGSGKFFRGRSIFVDLAVKNDKPAFEFLDEGGWRDAAGDTISAIEQVRAGKRTRTALSNNAFSAVPLEAYGACSLAKTEGCVLPLDPLVEIARYSKEECQEDMTPADIAKAIGHPEPPSRTPRIYSIFAPIEFLMISTLTPAEYAWYATRRRGKVFRQVLFTELRTDPIQLAAHNRFEEARTELFKNPLKKTKSIAAMGIINQTHFHDWVGYDRKVEGGLYFANRSRLVAYRFPEQIPAKWDRAH
jgi:hypothetical protein